MLKKIIITAAVVAFSATSLSTFAQVKVSGDVKARAVVHSLKDESKSKETASETSLVNGYGELFISYSQEVMAGWTATAGYGFELTNGRPGGATTTSGIRSKFAYNADGNFYVGLESKDVGFKLGDTRYLDAVASLADYEEAGTYQDGGGFGLSEYSISDNPDLSTRNGAIGFSLKAVPNLTLKAGVGMHSEKDNAKLEKNYTEFGLVASYAIAGAQFGAQFVNKAFKQEFYSDAGTPANGNTAAVDPTKKTTKVEVNDVVVGASYSLAQAANVPLTFWFGYWMHGQKNTLAAGGSSYLAPSLANGLAGCQAGNTDTCVGYDGDESKSFNAFEVGGKYNYGLGNVGLFVDMATYSKKRGKYGIDGGNKPDITPVVNYKGGDSVADYKNAQTALDYVLYLNHSLAANTTVYGSYWTSEIKQASVADIKATTAIDESKQNKTNESAFIIGLKQAF